MKKLLQLILFLFFIQNTYAQSDCSDPRMVTLCPTDFFQESTAGMGNNKTSWGCIGPAAGNDILYQINASSGVESLLVSFENVSDPFYLIWLGTDCEGSCITSRYISQTEHNISYNVSGMSGPFYFWVDHTNPSDVSFDVRFGSVMESVPLSKPDTRGAWEPSYSCTSEPFKDYDPMYDITWNGAYQYDPMTLSPLFTPGEMCVTTYLENRTGEMGLKRVTFDFGPDLVVSSVNVPDAFYNSGRWVVNELNSSFAELEFLASDGSIRGDFTGSPNECLAYEFCFTMEVLSNEPSTTTVDGVFYPDNYGAPRSGSSKPFCCPTPSLAKCSFSGTGSSGSPAGPIAIAFADPPVLPLSLLSFIAGHSSGKTLIRWKSTAESSIDRYEIEKSFDGLNFKKAGSVSGRNSDEINHYEYYDDVFSESRAYYRLRIVDKDGRYQYSKVISVQDYLNDYNLHVYPNPAEGEVYIRSIAGEKEILLTDQLGKIVVHMLSEKQEEAMSLEDLVPGIYYLCIIHKGVPRYSKIIKK
ncbi:MAG: T9SS type A sorting domain-containing protein [Cytophagaceae bacterium]